MKAVEAEQEFADTCGNWRECLEAISAQIDWLGHVHDYEVREAEAERIRNHARRLYVALRLPVKRIIDGE